LNTPGGRVQLNNMHTILNNGNCSVDR
jgi:hypothetical protein